MTLKAIVRLEIGDVDPMLPTPVEEAPRGSDWIKHDGYRTRLIIQDGKAKTFPRRGVDWTDRYRPIVAAAAELPAMSAIIDGEMILPTPTLPRSPSSPSTFSTSTERIFDPYRSSSAGPALAAG